MTTSLAFDGPRLLRPDERSASQRLSQICFSDMPPGDPPEVPAEAQPAQPGARRARSEEETYIISVDGRLVSQISLFFTPLYLNGMRLLAGHIGGVCTHPDYRGHRLAGRLMEHCSARLAEGGAQFMIISGERGLYRRAGCVEMGRFYDFQLWPGQPHPAARRVQLRRAQPSDAALAARLYKQESVHFARNYNAFVHGFQPHAPGFRAEEYLIHLDGRPAAYLLLNTPYDVLDQPVPRIRCVLEYAGSRVALAGAASLILTDLGLEALQFPVAWQDSDLAHLLQDCDPQPGMIHLPDHTLRLLNFPGLMHALRPHLLACLSPSQRRGLRFAQTGPLLAAAGVDRLSITHGFERLDLDGAGMSALVFGDPAGQRAVPGHLGELVNAIFPLPAFMLGLDYH
jgi:GNAT superfamily N-acetyltransferase